RVAVVLLAPSLVPPASGVPPRGARDVLADLAFAGGTLGDPCPGAARTRTIDITALAVPVSYNHWGDFDPFGRLFVVDEERAPLLEDVAGRLRDAGLATLANAVDRESAAFASASGDPVAAAQALQREASSILANASLE